MTARNELLRYARDRRALTGREVAHMVNMPESRISKLENGATVSEGTLTRYFDAGLITRDERIEALVGKAAA